MRVCRVGAGGELCQMLSANAVGVLPSARWYAKWPPSVNRRRAP